MKGRTKVLIFCILSLLNASIAYGASVVGSKHNLSYSSQPPDQKQPCAYCHTPHNANSTIVPLWNRNITNLGAFTMYTSTTMNTTCSSPPSGVSLACLSCHDDGIYSSSGTWEYAKTSTGGLGAVNIGDTHAVRNGPGSGVSDIVPLCSRCHTSSLNPIIPIGADLSNDHPISMTYPTAAQDPAFNIPPDLQNGWSDVKLFNGKVECASCHDPHDPSRGSFLRKSNSGSALCFTCHIK